MKFFITGGAGFIGRHLIKSLLKNNHKVTIYEDFSNSNKNNIEDICKDGALLIIGSLTDYSLLEKIHIGRIGTQNLNKNGYLYLYKLN